VTSELHSNSYLQVVYSFITFNRCDWNLTYSLLKLIRVRLVETWNMSLYFLNSFRCFWHRLFSNMSSEQSRRTLSILARNSLVLYSTRLLRGLFSGNDLQLLMVRSEAFLLSCFTEMFSLHSCMKLMKRLRNRETDGANSPARLAKLRLILIAWRHASRRIFVKVFRWSYEFE